MKNCFYIPLFLLIIGCNPPTNENNESKISTEKEIDSSAIPPEILEETPHEITINKKDTLELDQNHTDTIIFSTYNDDFDYFYLEGKKNDVFVSFIYDWDTNNEQYNFNLGDSIIVQWKMDSIYIAGDGESLDFAERAIDAKRLTLKLSKVKLIN